VSHDECCAVIIHREGAGYDHLARQIACLKGGKRGRICLSALKRFVPWLNRLILLAPLVILTLLAVSFR